MYSWGSPFAGGSTLRLSMGSSKKSRLFLDDGKISQTFSSRNRRGGTVGAESAQSLDLLVEEFK
jgi:hypothetical protein